MTTRDPLGAIMGTVALGSGTLQVMISVGLAIIAYNIWRRLDDVEKLTRKVLRNERQNLLMQVIVSNVDSYCGKNDEGFYLLFSLMERLKRVNFSRINRAEFSEDLSFLSHEVSRTLQELKRSKSLIALGASSEFAVQSALMYLSQTGDEGDYTSAINLLLVRQYVSDGSIELSGLPEVRQAHLKVWRERLKAEGKYIVHATWAPPTSIKDRAGD